MSHAFVYGTLMAPEVLQCLLRRVPSMVPATIIGYKRSKLTGVVFPAIVAADGGSSVEGMVSAKLRMGGRVERNGAPPTAMTLNACLHGAQLLQGLSPNEMRILDGYESKEYYRADVMARLEDGSEVEADVYVWKVEYRNMVTGETWDYQEWRKLYLHKWVARLSPDLPHPKGMLDD